MIMFRSCFTTAACRENEILIKLRPKSMVWSCDSNKMDNCSGTYYSNETSPVPGRRTPLGTVGLSGYYYSSSGTTMLSNENRPAPQLPNHHHSENRLVS